VVVNSLIRNLQPSPYLGGNPISYSVEDADEADSDESVLDLTLADDDDANAPAGSRPLVLPTDPGALGLLRQEAERCLGSNSAKWITLAQTPLATPSNQPAYRLFQRWAASRHILRVLGMLDQNTITISGHDFRCSDVIGWLNFRESTWSHNTSRFRSIQHAHGEIERSHGGTPTGILALSTLSYFAVDEHAIEDPPSEIRGLQVPELWRMVMQALPDLSGLKEAQKNERSEAQKRAKQVRRGP